MVKARVVVAGEARGPLLVSRQPISFWGGVRAQTGDLIDRRHDRCGENVVGKVFAFPYEKGSSTSSAILLEAVRLAKAPAALIVTKTPPVLALGSIIARELYGRAVPIVAVSEEVFAGLEDGMDATVHADGVLQLEHGA